ncbi:hypothetical protein [Methylobacterium haplocladii]|nr:hypothetical protein [Methylobacterium haplocladii]GJD86456.1 hypothetical protein HPGCJGGD_4363 [Methylobacterium haplocladii]
MAIYLATFDLQAIEHDYSTLYSKLKSLGAHQAQATTWFIESDVPMLSLSDTFLGAMDGSDSLLLVAISPSTAWAATRLSGLTGEWLQRVRP